MSDNKNREFVRTLHSMIADFLRDNPDIDRSYYQEIWDWLEKKEESEDERMIRILKEGLKGLTVFNYTPVSKILAWLEKQKEQVLKVNGLYYYDGDKVTYCGYPPIKENPYDFAMSRQEKQKEHKPINWTELNGKDIAKLEVLINIVHNEYPNGIGQESFGDEVLERFREYKEDENLDRKEQKPDENITDEEIKQAVDDIHNFKIAVTDLAKTFNIRIDHDRDIDWHNFCASLLTYLKRHAELSEEDRKMIDHLIEALPTWAKGRIAMLPSQADEYVKRLKSLLSRFE